MADPTITCPNCGTGIKLTESIATSLLAAAKKEFDAKLAARNAEIAREQEKRAEAERAQLDAIRKERELYDEKYLLMITAAKKIP